MMKKIFHIGMGNFHRAHQAWYTQNAGGGWRIVAASLRSPDVRNALRAQNNNYTLVIRGVSGNNYERMVIHDNVLVAPENPNAIIAQISDPETLIITVTVTEKAYYLDNSTGRVRLDHPVLQEEIASGKPVTLLGYLAWGLKARMERHSGPLTIMSCDNLTDNGDRLRSAVIEFAQAAGLGIEEYVSQSVTFPNAMVDRITPATTDTLRDEVLAQTGWNDAAPVETEIYSEWVIEDNFVTKRPHWESAGAKLVQNVVPYELRKLRLLNGPHSLLAYMGQLRGYEYVHEAIVDPVIAKTIKGLMLEATATLPADVRVDAAVYCEALIERFANPSLKHSLNQIAIDGTLKLPIRIISVLIQREAEGLPSPFAIEALACWMAFVLKQTKAGNELDDPQTEEVARICNTITKPMDRTSALLGLLAAVEWRPDLIAEITAQTLLQRCQP